MTICCVILTNNFHIFSKQVEEIADLTGFKTFVDPIHPVQEIIHTLLKTYNQSVILSFLLTISPKDAIYAGVAFPREGFDTVANG
jgi:hypothetical protein